MSFRRKFLDSFYILKDMFLDFLRLGHGYAVGLVFIVLFGFMFQMAGWWYLMLLAGGIGGFFMKKSLIPSLIAGFVGVALVWFGFFLYFMIIGPLFEFVALISTIIGIFEDMPTLLIIITIVIGGMLGGLGAVNGTYIADIIYPKQIKPKKIKSSKPKISTKPPKQ